MNKPLENWEATEDPAIVLDVREAQIRQLFSQSWIGLTGVFVVMLSVCFIFWDVVPQWKLELWAGLSAVLTILRSLLTVSFKREAPLGADIYRWARLHVLGAALSGALWAAASIFLWPVHFPTHQIVLPVCIVALSAVAVATYCTWPASYLSFLLLSTAPLSLRLLKEGGIVYAVLGLLAMIFIAILLQTGREMHAASLQALVMGMRNKALNSVISGEKNVIEGLNARLQQEIHERTLSQNDLQLRNQELELLNMQLIATKTNLESTNGELELALASVKQLSGMLPICASCKSIRNDDGYWEQIEAYFKDHSELEFSHGICPKCVEKLYPGLRCVKEREQAGQDEERPFMSPVS